MKVTRFLTVLGASVAVVSCTNEEFVDNTNIVNNDGRPAVKIAIDADYTGDEMGSRMIPSGTDFMWEADDELGASRIDGSTLYTVVGGKHFSNAKFTIKDKEAMPSTAASFTTNNTLSIGSYLFYYPYSSEMTNTSDGVKFNLDVVQEYDADGTKMLDNNFMVSPVVDVAGYEEGTLTIPVKMRSIYSYGKLTLKLGDNTTVSGVKVTELEVQKVAIKAKSGESFTVKGVIDNTNIADGKGLNNGNKARAAAYQGTTEEAIASKMDDQFEELEEYVGGEKAAKYFEAIDDIFAERSLVYASSTASNYLTASIDGTVTELYINYLKEGSSEGQKISGDSELTTRFLIPAGKYDNGLDVVVYTNKGVYTTSTTTNLVAKRGYTLNLANPNRIEANEETAIEIGILTPSTDAITVVSKEDFLASMKQYSNVAIPTDVNVNFAPGVEFTSDMNSAIPANVKLIVNSDVTVNGDMTLGNVEFEDDVTIAGGNVNISDNVVVAQNKYLTINGGNVTVGKLTAGFAGHHTKVNGGTFNLPNAAVFTTNLYVNNGATVNFGSPAATTNTVPAKDIQNIWWHNLDGTANIYVPVKMNQNLTVGTTTKSELNVYAEVAMNSKTVAVGSNGTVNVFEDASISIIENSGKIVNEGSLTVTTNKNAIESTGTLTVTTNEEEQTAGTAKLMPTIDFNNGNATVAINKGIVNNKVNFLDGSLQISSNVGDINLKENSQTDFVANLAGQTVAISNTGNIYYTEGAIINHLSDKGSRDERGHIVYTVNSDTNVSSINFGPCTALLVKDATLTIDKALTVMDLHVATLSNANLVLNVDQELYKFAVYIDGKCQVSGSKGLYWDKTTLSSYAGSKIVLKNGSELTNSTVLANLSSIAVETNPSGSTATVINTGDVAVNSVTPNGLTWKGKSYQNKPIAMPTAE